MSTEEEEKQIAEWMLAEFERQGYLRQKAVAWHLQCEYGGRHLYKNVNGHSALNKSLLDKFAQLKPDERVWIRSKQAWRKRRPEDPEGTRMVRR
jgi:hypothetical protein